MPVLFSSLPETLSMNAEVAQALNDVAAIDTVHISGKSTPWLPFAPINDKIHLKYFRINPVTGEVVLLMKAAKGEGAHIHRHTGTVMVYTLSGRWKYDQHGWIAEAGDFVFEPSESSHSFTNLSDDDNGTALVVSTGELHFLDEQGNVTHVETWRTALNRYQAYCKRHGLPEVDLIGCQGSR
ncbi:cupin domain-containing protein [Paraburkholderia silviterrae]|uniref:Cupin domain-containing protein n=2 Tax=Paraburkholderia silviterrae TaxID=2528715 RepID=A0A4R5LXC7_9BURK|nr:cupin domain-containing protein [Paraburkholderia silviterrae]